MYVILLLPISHSVTVLQLHFTIKFITHKLTASNWPVRNRTWKYSKGFWYALKWASPIKKPSNHTQVCIQIITYSNGKLFYISISGFHKKHFVVHMNTLEFENNQMKTKFLPNCSSNMVWSCWNLRLSWLPSSSSTVTWLSFKIITFLLTRFKKIVKYTVAICRKSRWILWKLHLVVD